jgi:hypothetical protein
MGLTVTSDGLRYIGEDWTVQSGGGYSAGFQSLDEFLRDGPPPRVHMPDDVAARVRDEVDALATAGRPTLAVTIVVEAPVVLRHASVELDGFPVLVRDFDDMPAEVEVHRGTSSPGKHRIGWAVFAGERRYGEVEVDLTDAGADVRLVVRGDGVDAIVA